MHEIGYDIFNKTLTRIEAANSRKTYRLSVLERMQLPRQSEASLRTAAHTFSVVSEQTTLIS